MAITTEAIRKITIQGSTQGVDEATAALNKLAAAQGNVAVVSDTSSKKQLSAADAYRRQTLAVVDGARQQDLYQKSLKVVDAALQQGIITQAEHAKRVDLLKDKYGQAGFGAKAFAAATQGVSGQLIALSAGAGPVGVFLSALGPWGIAAAVGLGAAEKAISLMSDAAHGLAQKAEELRKFSEATGLTTDQVQALRSEASKFGVSSEDAAHAIQQFTARFDQLRQGNGELLTQIRRVNPALADQMAGLTNSADALTLFGQALEKTDNIFQRNALVRAATGKSGINAAQFLTGLNVNQITQSFTDAGKALDHELIEKLARLEIEINKTGGKAKENIASIFAAPVLEAELKFLTYFREISEIAKNFTVSDALQKMAVDIPKWAMLIPVIGPLAGAAGAIGRLAGAAGVGQTASAPWWATQQTPARPGIGNGLLGTINSFLPGGIGQSTAITPEYQLSKLKDLIQILGQAATPAEQLKLKEAELAIAAKNAGVSQEVFNRALGGLLLNDYVQGLQRMVAALGSVATPEEQLTARVAALREQLSGGSISLETFNRAFKGLNADEEIRQLRDANAALGDAATPAEQYALRIKELQAQLDRGAISQDVFNRALLNANPTFRELKDTATSFAQDFVHGMMQGKSAIDALTGALSQLATKLADKAIVDLISGNYVQAGIEGAAAIGAYFAGQSQQKKQAQQQAQAAAIQRAQQFDTQRMLTAFDPSTREGALGQFDINAAAQIRDEQRAGGQALAVLEATLAAQRLGIEKQFDDQSAAQAAQAAADRLAAEKQAEQDRLNIVDDFSRKLNEVTGKGFLNQFSDLFKEIDQARGAGVGENLLEQFLGASAQQIVDQAGLVGDSFQGLIRTFPQLSGVVHESTVAMQAAIDEQRRLTNQAAKNIVDYLNSLLTGPTSALSPQQRFVAAQSTYSATLALAQGGNTDALNRITGDAETYRKAAQDLYASSASYQAVLQAIQNQLINLPAVQTADDPVVVAIRNVVAAVQDTTSTVDKGNAIATQSQAVLTIMKGFTDATQQNTASQVSLQNTQNALIGSSNSLLTATNAFLNSTNQLLGAIRDINTTLTNQFTSIPFIAFGQFGSAQNNLLTALNKLVVNTYAIQENTWGTFAILDRMADEGIAAKTGLIGFNGRAGWDTHATSIAGGIRTGALEHGGTIPPYGTALVMEHYQPTMLTAGPKPIQVFPGYPGGANDNSQLLARIDRLERTLADSLRLLTQIAAKAGDDERELLQSIDDNLSLQAREQKFASQAA